jgi:hypothetical protein
MSIEINNESGVEVDEARDRRARPLRARRDGHQPAGRAVGRAGRRRRDGRQLHSSGWTCPARPTCWPSRWTSCESDRGSTEDARRPRRACSATSCCARRSPPTRPSRPGTRPSRAAPAVHRTASCTCSATTTPSRRRSGDVRAAGQAARRVGRHRGHGHPRRPANRAPAARFATPRVRSWLTRRSAGPAADERPRTVLVLIGAIALVGSGGRWPASTRPWPGSRSRRVERWSARGAGRPRLARAWWPTGPATPTCCCCSGSPAR